MTNKERDRQANKKEFKQKSIQVMDTEEKERKSASV